MKLQILILAMIGMAAAGSAVADPADLDGDGSSEALEWSGGSNFLLAVSQVASDDDGDGTANQLELTPRSMYSGAYGYVVSHDGVGGYAIPTGLVTVTGVAYYVDNVLLEDGWWVWDSHCDGMMAVEGAVLCRATSEYGNYTRQMAADPSSDGWGYRWLPKSFTPYNLVVATVNEQSLCDVTYIFELGEVTAGGPTNCRPLPNGTTISDGALELRRLLEVHVEEFPRDSYARWTRQIKDQAAALRADFAEADATGTNADYGVVYLEWSAAVKKWSDAIDAAKSIGEVTSERTGDFVVCLQAVAATYPAVYSTAGASGPTAHCYEEWENGTSVATLSWAQLVPSSKVSSQIVALQIEYDALASYNVDEFYVVLTAYLAGSNFGPADLEEEESDIAAAYRELVTARPIRSSEGGAAVATTPAESELPGGFTGTTWAIIALAFVVVWIAVGKRR